MSTSSYPLSSPMGRVLQTQGVISFLLLDITVNITTNEKLNNLFHSIWDKHKFSEERDKKIKEQLKRFMQKCRLSKDSSSVTDRLGLSSQASKLSKGNIKLLTLLLMKKGKHNTSMGHASDANCAQDCKQGAKCEHV
ncbi:hypothetical protein DPMN_019685 [Dreissena polymorpha]|uniref:Uncharacterized protein n=1 Tax=Dreissena polymorpha TaxID=45954 RepID=A0A9D4NHG5_DREPO|nr:hypothetical protein DPMN_019685 [Dreissena polymorpha]